MKFYTDRKQYIMFKLLLVPDVIQDNFIFIQYRAELITLAAASAAVPPCLKRDHGARWSIYKFPTLPISRAASQADDRERFS